MKTNYTATQIPRNRQEELVLWLRQAETTYVALAEKLGLSSGGYLSRMLAKDTIAPHYHEQLRKLGMPESVLPIPMHRKLGRPPKNQVASAA